MIEIAGVVAINAVFLRTLLWNRQRQRWAHLLRMPTNGGEQ